MQARCALAGQLCRRFVEHSLAVEGPQQPLVPGVDALHVPDLRPPAAAPGALGNGTSVTWGRAAGAGGPRGQRDVSSDTRSALGWVDTQPLFTSFSSSSERKVCAALNLPLTSP